MIGLSANFGHVIDHSFLAIVISLLRVQLWLQLSQLIYVKKTWCVILFIIQDMCYERDEIM